MKANVVHAMKMCRAFVENGFVVTLFIDRNVHEIDIDTVFRQYGEEKCFAIQTVYMSNRLKKHLHRFGSYITSWMKSKQNMNDGYAYCRSTMSLFFLRRRMPFVYEAHVEPDVLNRQFERSILRHRNCRGLVVISNALKKRYMELFPFFPEERILVLHDAADLDTSNSDTKANLHGPSANLHIGYVGSLFPGKCMETLIPLAQRCPQFLFHIVGGTEYWINHWKEKAQTAGVNNLVFYGHVDNGQLGDYYRAFDLCIMPFSRNIYISKNKLVDIGRWTSPLKLFEAMAYGKPIISSRLSTIEEVMSDGKDCILVEPENLDDWERKLIMLCEDAALRKRIGLAAQDKLQREYTWTERARKAAKLFAL